MDRKLSAASMSSRSSSASSTSRNTGPLLPYANNDTPIKVKTLLGHSLYRRVLVWAVVGLVVAAIALFHTREGASYDVARYPFGTVHPSAVPSASATSGQSTENGSENEGSKTMIVVVPDLTGENEALQTEEKELELDQGEQPPAQGESQHVEEQQATEQEAQEGQEQNDETSASEQPVGQPVGDEQQEAGVNLTEEEEEEGPQDGKKEEAGPEEEHRNEIDEEAKKQFEADLEKTPWLKFKHLDGYFFGLKSLVKLAGHNPEYPDPSRQEPISPPPINKDTPKPRPYNPYTSADDVETCYLDVDKKVAAPDIFAYDGVPQHLPDPSIGSHEVLGLRNDVCFDRFGRYGPYGLGYSKVQGGSGVGMDTEAAENEAIWAQTGRINYVGMDWGGAQERCYQANKHRFQELDPETQELKPAEGKKGRVAVVVRLYTDFHWTEHVVLNFRALINELSLKSGGEYNVHFLMQVRDQDKPIWADEATVQRLLDAHVPKEFQKMVTLWSEPQMKLMYPGSFEDAVSNPSGQDIHGVYRSAHMPLQVFATDHPEYEHIWNWEMDMRYVGSYYELFDRVSKWAEKQPRPLLWERNERYYIPSYHGSWENFTSVVQQNSIDSGRPTIFGPLKFPGYKPLRREQRGESNMPKSCNDQYDKSQCGVGEPADLITFNPIFDTDGSGWIFGLDASGYGSNPPRRCAIITASRMSRRLLMSMHEEVWRYHHTMFTEMFPSSVALHHGFKAVYAPHPVFLDRAWNPPASIDAAFNGGRDHSASGGGSPFDLRNEHNHKGTSWYFHSEFAGLLWRRWLGYSQMDGRGDFGGRANEGQERGGMEEESGEHSTGRMCLRSMLAHPIKFENPADK